MSANVGLLYCNNTESLHIYADSRQGYWLGLLTCKNRLPYNLYCVGGDVKHCSINQSINQSGILHITDTLFALVSVTTEKGNELAGLNSSSCTCMLGCVNMFIFKTNMNEMDNITNELRVREYVTPAH